MSPVPVEHPDQVAMVQVPVPEGVSKDAALWAVQVLGAHHDLLREVAKKLAEAHEAPSPAVLGHLARVEGLWRTVESRWGLLDAEQVTALTGGNPAKARAHTANLRARRGVVGVQRHGALRYPGFQFRPNGAVRVEWVDVAKVLTKAGWTGSEVVLWAVSPTGWLDGRVPVEVLDDDPVAVVQAAETVAEGTAA